MQSLAREWMPLDMMTVVVVGDRLGVMRCQTVETTAVLAPHRFVVPGTQQGDLLPQPVDQDFDAAVRQAERLKDETKDRKKRD